MQRSMLYSEVKAKLVCSVLRLADTKSALCRVQLLSTELKSDTNPGTWRISLRIALLHFVCWSAAAAIGGVGVGVGVGFDGCKRTLSDV